MYFKQSYTMTPVNIFSASATVWSPAPTNPCSISLLFQWRDRLCLADLDPPETPRKSRIARISIQCKKKDEIGKEHEKGQKKLQKEEEERALTVTNHRIRPSSDMILLTVLLGFSQVYSLSRLVSIHFGSHILQIPYHIKSHQLRQLVSFFF